MNSANLQILFRNYADRFQEINEPPNRELYKWTIACQFKPMMDSVLAMPDGELPGGLYQVRKLTGNLIDSYIQPFTGLSRFAEQEPGTVRDMFVRLFAASRAPLPERQQAMADFLAASHELRDRYYPDSHLYSDDFHSVSTYLALYDPDFNCIYKATHARDFADCIGFYDDWGSGEHVKLDVYYRMCDQTADAIRADGSFSALCQQRYQPGFCGNSEPLHPDRSLYLQVFDLIYCCSTYRLFTDTVFTTPTAARRSQLAEMKQKALQYQQEAEEAAGNLSACLDAREAVFRCFSPGARVTHRREGAGVVTEGPDSSGSVTIQFQDQKQKRFSLLFLLEKKLLAPEAGDAAACVSENLPLARQESALRAAVRQAEAKLEPYLEYLD